MPQKNISQMGGCVVVWGLFFAFLIPVSGFAQQVEVAVEPSPQAWLRNSLSLSDEALEAFERLGPPRNPILKKPYDLFRFGNQSKKVLPVVRLSVYSQDMREFIGFCSATLISDSQALTARHCLDLGVDQVHLFVLTDFYKKGEMMAQPDALTWAAVESVEDQCLPGWCRAEGDRFNVPQPMLDEVSPYHIHFGTQAENDWVLLNLTKPLGQEVGIFKIADSAQDLSQVSLSFAGFPANANAVGDFEVPVKHIAHDCEVIQSAMAPILFSNCQSEIGLSGGPLYYEQDGDFYFVGLSATILRSQSPAQDPFEVSIFNRISTEDLLKAAQ